MVARPLLPTPTRADLEKLPSNVKGEIIEGVMHTQPRPRSRHSKVILNAGADLVIPFERGTGGPGGWWILVEPGVELPDAAEVAPDIAGWRRERLPTLPDPEPIRVVPDWVCEVLSSSNRSYDVRIKRPFYARVGVKHLWYVDVEARTLSVSRLANGQWLEVGVYGESDVVRAEPFAEVEIALANWWAER